MAGYKDRDAESIPEPVARARTEIVRTTMLATAGKLNAQ